MSDGDASESSSSVIVAGVFKPESISLELFSISCDFSSSESSGNDKKTKHSGAHEFKDSLTNESVV